MPGDCYGNVGGIVEESGTRVCCNVTYGSFWVLCLTLGKMGRAGDA
jgi:hypothetical protein